MIVKIMTAISWVVVTNKSCVSRILLSWQGPALFWLKGTIFHVFRDSSGRRKLRNIRF